MKGSPNYIPGAKDQLNCGNLGYEERTSYLSRSCETPWRELAVTKESKLQITNGFEDKAGTLICSGSIVKKPSPPRI